MTKIDPAIVVSVFLVNRRWYERWPAAIQRIMAEEGARIDRQPFDWTTNAIGAANRTWAQNGGEPIRLPPDEQERMMREFAAIGEQVMGQVPAVKAEYDALARTAQRLA